MVKPQSSKARDGGVGLAFGGPVNLRCLALLALVGCNALTGVGNLSLESDDGDDGDEDGTSAGAAPGGPSGGPTSGVGGTGSGPTSGSGPSTGSGDNTSTGTSGAGGTGSTGSTGSGTTSTGGPTGSGTGDGVTTSSTGSGMQACEYPGGPYGNTSGKILEPTSWSGFAPGSSSSTSVSVEELFDCDGSKGIHAVIFTTAQTSCGPCQQEAQYDIAPNVASWSSQGIVVVTLMYGGGASNWRNYFDLQDTYVVDDPSGTFFTGNGDATPTNVIWDPRTGEIVEWWQGAGGLEAAEQLAAQNAN
jgi:hypothetical protein